MTEAFQWTCPRCGVLASEVMRKPDGSPLREGAMVVCNLCAAILMCDPRVKGALRGLTKDEWRTLKEHQPTLLSDMVQKQAEIMRSLTGHRRRRALLLPAFVAVKDVPRVNAARSPSTR